MNAPPQRDIPECLTKRETSAVFGWFSTRRLLITKGTESVDLSADDLANLRRFFDSFDTERQPS